MIVIVCLTAILVYDIIIRFAKAGAFSPSEKSANNNAMFWFKVRRHLHWLNQ